MKSNSLSVWMTFVNADSTIFDMSLLFGLEPVYVLRLSYVAISIQDDNV